MTPERCKRCGWMDGLRPDTCHGDGEHNFEPIPKREWTLWQREAVQRARGEEAEHDE